MNSAASTAAIPGVPSSSRPIPKKQDRLHAHVPGVRARPLDESPLAQGFTRPVNRFTGRPRRRALLPDDAEDLLLPAYDPAIKGSAAGCCAQSVARGGVEALAKGRTPGAELTTRAAPGPMRPCLVAVVDSAVSAQSSQYSAEDGHELRGPARRRMLPQSSGISAREVTDDRAMLSNGASHSWPECTLRNRLGAQRCPAREVRQLRALMTHQPLGDLSPRTISLGLVPQTSALR